MKRNFIFCILLIACVFPLHQQIYAGRYNSNVLPSFFRDISVPVTFIIPPSKLISFKAKMLRNKVLLQWVIGENETTDQFEIEKSNDGKIFTLAALVFGTDKPDTDSYEYYDKMKEEKKSYRLKIIDKNKKIEYSDIIVIRSK